MTYNLPELSQSLWPRYQVQFPPLLSYRFSTALVQLVHTWRHCCARRWTALEDFPRSQAWARCLTLVHNQFVIIVTTIFIYIWFSLCFLPSLRPFWILPCWLSLTWCTLSINFTRRLNTSDIISSDTMSLGPTLSCRDFLFNSSLLYHATLN